MAQAMDGIAKVGQDTKFSVMHKHDVFCIMYGYFINLITLNDAHKLLNAQIKQVMLSPSMALNTNDSLQL